MLLGEVPCCDANLDSAADFQSHRANVSPLIFRNFTSAHGWSATERWCDIDYLSDVVGDEMTPVHVVDRQASFDPSMGSKETVLMPWAKAVKDIFDTAGAATLDRLYLKSGMKAKLLEDVTPLPHAVFGFGGVEKISTSLAKVWVGSKGNVTPLHFDLCHGCLIQIVGAKDVILFPLETSRSLYPFPSSCGAPRTSRLDLDALLAGCKTTEETFPLAKDAIGGVRCRIYAGDALYIPPFWWHHVTAAEDNVSVIMPFDMSKEEQSSAERPWISPEWGVYA